MRTESRILEAVKADLLDPSVIAEVERRVRRALKAQSKPANHGKRIVELQREIENLTDAIAGGLLKSSPALAQRLAAAEAELACLQAASKRQSPAAAQVVPMIARHCRAKVAQLDELLNRDVEQARVALQDVIGPRVVLQPDESGRFLWAETEIETAPLLGAVGSDLMVAGLAANAILRCSLPWISPLGRASLCALRSRSDHEAPRRA